MPKSHIDKSRFGWIRFLAPIIPSIPRFYGRMKLRQLVTCLCELRTISSEGSQVVTSSLRGVSSPAKPFKRMHKKGSAIITAAINQSHRRPTHIGMFPFLVPVALFTLARATPSGSCVGTIPSPNDVSAAIQCTTVNANALTVPAGETFNLDLLQDTTEPVAVSPSPAP